MQAHLNIAVRAARKAGNIVSKGFWERDRVKVAEKAANDFVTEIDKKSEAAIVDILTQTYPEHGILAEEGSEKSGNEYTWIIDPLDGTHNFINGIPHFAISIALLHKGRLEQGVIYDPIKDDLFTASRGGGATLNEQRIRVTNTKNLDNALLATGLRIPNKQKVDQYLSTVNAMLKVCTDIRRMGSASLDLAYVAAGKMDGYWEYNLQPWDIAAGCLLVQEAGGMVSDTDGAPKHLDNGNVLAATPKLFKVMAQTLRR
ncbi:MAG: inositol monophosphatase family protein [Pseudomonadota bacterium]